jgi:L-alanine-DL-glutamate epimerase-like enolase superfamily enzyme
MSKQSELNIEDLAIYKAKKKLAKPICDATHQLTEISFVVLRLRLQNGIIGESHLLSFQYSPQAIQGAFKDCTEYIVGHAAHETGLIFDRLNHLHEYFGRNGLLRWVQGAINIAMWDAWGIYLQQPLWKLWGTYRDRVPLYGSGGWISYTIDELLEEVVDYVNRGFKAVKIKVGSPDWKTDLERLKKVRDAVGDRVNIMMDANQGMHLPEAIQLAKAATDLNIHWFEEPFNHENTDAFQSLKTHTGISLAMGEREYNTKSLIELIHRRAIDIWQPDILRIGGVDAWRESAAIAAGFHIPILPHYYKNYDVPLLCSTVNGIAAESFDWIDDLIDNPMRVEEGFAYPYERPGWGFRFEDQFLEKI